ncbi:MAG TPA: hypothetical protein PKA66_07545 [Gemmatimonadales bacterium]|nr:hypothetical protein [Gemmatimonadales bacterium]
MGRCETWKSLLRGTLVLLSIPTATLAGQGQTWHVTATASQTWFSGGLDDTTASEGTWGLTPKLTWGLAADRELGKVRVGLGLSYISSHIQVSDEQVTLIEGTLDLREVGVAAFVTVPLVRLASEGASIDLLAGPVLGIWSLTDADTRMRIGGAATLQVTAPLTPTWLLLATLGGSVSGSPFDTSDLPDFFEATTLWATTAGLGVRHAF